MTVSHLLTTCIDPHFSHSQHKFSLATYEGRCNCIYTHYGILISEAISLAGSGFPVLDLHSNNGAYTMYYTAGDMGQDHNKKFGLG